MSTRRYADLLKGKMRVILLTNDAASRRKAGEEGLEALGGWVGGAGKDCGGVTCWEGWRIDDFCALAKATCCCLIGQSCHNWACFLQTDAAVLHSSIFVLTLY
jgi:hypothetical protein